MMNKIIVLSPKISKESSQLLAESLGADLEFPFETDNRDFSKYDYVFKYGFSKKIKAKKGCSFNKADAVVIAKDKLLTFNALKGLDITVEFTQDFEQALAWSKDGHTVVAREFSSESNGKGITYCTTPGELQFLPPQKFWTKCIYETQEMRVNLWRDKVLSIYVKAITKKGFFKFELHKGLEEHPQLVDIAQKVYKNIGLDFCGLDVLQDNGKLRILEVNSAPILFPYTVKKLTACINKEINK